MAPTDLYPCAPGGRNDYAYIITTTKEMWESLVKSIGRPDILSDPRFSEPSARNKHFDELFEIIASWTRQRSKFEVMRILGQAGIPCGAVLDSGDVLTNEHLKARGMIQTIEHPARGSFTMPGCAVQLTDSPVEVRPAPLLGQHNSEIFGSLLGLTMSDLANLKENGVI
jgi:formyl-CoA transferase